MSHEIPSPIILTQPMSWTGPTSRSSSSRRMYLARVHPAPRAACSALRLELLLGAKPAAPVDDRDRARTEPDARGMADRKQRIAEAGGRLVAAALEMLQELLPRPEDGRTVTTCGAEDLIVHKAFAGRDKDWLDVRGIVTRQGRGLDQALIWSELLPLLELREDTTTQSKLHALLSAS